METNVWVTQSPTHKGFVLENDTWFATWEPRWMVLNGVHIILLIEEPKRDDEFRTLRPKALGEFIITAKTKILDEDDNCDSLGFIIHINNSRSPHDPVHFRADSIEDKMEWIISLNQAVSIANWLASFSYIRTLGSGGTAIVYEVIDKETSKRFAMKVIDINNETEAINTNSEADMLRKVKENVFHRSILKVERIVSTGTKVYLLFQLCRGGDLYEYVKRHGTFSERDASLIMQDVLVALHTLHKAAILHLDIKLENILFDAELRIKITDFGNSMSLSDDTRLMPTSEQLSQRLDEIKRKGYFKKHLNGTVGYTSPEQILLGHNSPAADIFSSGIVLYLLLCGQPPFGFLSKISIIERTIMGEYDPMEGPIWDSVSPEAKDLIGSMMETDPNKRISLDGALAHPWFHTLQSVVPQVQSQRQSSLSCTGIANTAVVEVEQCLQSPVSLSAGGSDSYSFSYERSPGDSPTVSFVNNISTHESFNMSVGKQQQLSAKSQSYVEPGIKLSDSMFFSVLTSDTPVEEFSYNKSDAGYFSGISYYVPFLGGK